MVELPGAGEALEEAHCQQHLLQEDQVVQAVAQVEVEHRVCSVNRSHRCRYRCLVQVQVRQAYRLRARVAAFP